MPEGEGGLRLGTLALYVALVAAAALFLYRVRAVLTPFLLALALSYVMNPVVTRLSRRGAPRSAGTLIVYVGVTLVIALIAAYVVPRFLAQLERLAQVVPEQAAQIQARLVSFYARFTRFNVPGPVKDAVDEAILRVQGSIAELLRRAVTGVPALVPRMTMLALVPVLAFYFTMDFPEIKMWLLSWVPRRWRSEVVGVLIEMDRALGSFIRGQLVVSAVVGVLISIGLSIIGVDFALVIGLLAGVLDIIPYFGPVIGALPAVVFALLKSPPLALYVVALFIVVNQLESGIVGPRIIGEHVGLHPVAVIFAVLAGGHLMGITGVLLAAPVAAVAKVILRYLLARVVP